MLLLRQRKLRRKTKYKRIKSVPLAGSELPRCDAILAATGSKRLMFHLDVAHGWKLPRRSKMRSQPRGISACSIIMQIRTYVRIRATIRDGAPCEDHSRRTGEHSARGWIDDGRSRGKDGRALLASSHE